ncbi:2-hydroxyacid dehydrogenase [Arenivirga flava]|uniref:2-hydroxyacid dehydrogenase n=1 Tax=Arenivirga flava TaxID=1930060 RepID=A0AA37XBA4_9MICO|nr:2-hydroxyacid dehydrogenase [Arenivirga flava]GMA28558.1 2-hydroxyacid dehydrogenase [Arenivirga flava]
MVGAAGRRDDRPALPGAHVLVGPRFTTPFTAAADALRLVHVAGAGVDGIDEQALPPGVAVANTFHHEASIAEYAVATTVLMRRRLQQQDAALRHGRWASPVYDPALQQSSGLDGATVGFVGLGHIGRRAWQAFRALGARGIAVSRSGSSAEGLAWTATVDRLHQLLDEADVLVLCLPLRAETRHLIGEHELWRLGPDAMLVNVARGAVVDPAALYTALAERRIGGAVIDTWYAYPTAGAAARPAEQPFELLDNVFMTPHISGVTTQTFRGRVRDIARNLQLLARGDDLERVVLTGR